jgi:hypothetical protein
MRVPIEHIAKNNEAGIFMRADPLQAPTDGPSKALAPDLASEGRYFRFY